MLSLENESERNFFRDRKFIRFCFCFLNCGEILLNFLLKKAKKEGKRKRSGLFADFSFFFEVIVSIKRKSTSLTGLKIRASSALALRSALEGLHLLCLEGLNSGCEFLFKKELHFFNIFGPVMFNISRVAFVLFNRIGILMDSRFVLCNRI